MIDICPVGALTSKPFRYSARTWELSRRKSISPHDSTGANLIVQVKNQQVLRVVPLENEAVNECWIADRDRFSYEALNSPERLTSPMIKHGGNWVNVDWQTALEYVANGLKQIKSNHGAASIGALVSPHSTLEELHLAGLLVRGLGSENIDYRLRNADFTATDGVRYLGAPIASLTTLQRVLIVGSNLRKDHPLFAQRIRQAAKSGCAVHVLGAGVNDWAIALKQEVQAAPAHWLAQLQGIAAAVAELAQVASPFAVAASAEAQAIAKSLMGGERKAILLGNASAHHGQASALLAVANWIAQHTGATVGYLTEAANTVGAQFVHATPSATGLHAGQMLGGALKAVLLLNTEPEFDSAPGAAAVANLAKAEMVVSLSPFRANMACADVLLPIAPFSETSGTFVNAEGRVQGFHAVVKPQGDARPAWKVLRVLGNMMNVVGFDFESSQDVLKAIFAGAAPEFLPSDRLGNACSAPFAGAYDGTEPCVARIYQLDSLVRRASSLQMTADARVAPLVASEGVLA
jgi:NADH-quinone oxidoreductase subunit G